MNPLRYKIVNKSQGFSKEMIHIRDNCFMYMDSQFVNIVLEHDNSLECHGFSRNAIDVLTLKSIMNQPILNAADESLVTVVKDTINNQLIKQYDDYKELRIACNHWDGTYYIHKVYWGTRASVYAFVYRIAGGNTIVCLQVVNYGKRNMEGSFAIEMNILNKVYDILVRKGK